MIRSLTRRVVDRVQARHQAHERAEAVKLIREITQYIDLHETPDRRRAFWRGLACVVLTWDLAPDIRRRWERNLSLGTWGDPCPDDDTVGFSVLLSLPTELRARFDALARRPILAGKK